MAEIPLPDPRVARPEAINPHLCTPPHGHVYVWGSSTTRPTTPEPPIGTRCACGAKTYQGEEEAARG